MQTKSKMMAVIGAVLIVAIMLFTPWGSNIFPASVNTKSVNKEYTSVGGSIRIDNPYLKTTNSLNYQDVGEVLDSYRYVVSWQPGEYSVRVTAKVDALLKTRYETLYSLLYGFGSFPTTFVRNSYWWEVTYTDVSGKSIRIIDGKNFTGGSTGINTDYVNMVRSLPRRGFPNQDLVVEDVPAQTEQKNWFAPRDTSAATETLRLETDTLVFSLKGDRVGTLNVKCYLNDSMYANYDHIAGWLGPIPLYARAFTTTGPLLLSEDTAELVSGRGEVRIETTVDAKAVSWEKTLETNILYQVLAFEEGSSVVFSVDAGYSGKTLESDQTNAVTGLPGGYGSGWNLQIVNSKGTTVKTYAIPDGSKNYKVTYTVPAGAFISGGDNEWMVVLSNTLFDQSETRIWVVDSYAKTPGIAKVSVQSNNINQFESITWSASANPNPNGTKEIRNFKVWATYGLVSSTDYALTARNYPAVKSGNVYTASGSFMASKGDKTVRVFVMSIDSTGRAAIGAGYTDIYVKQSLTPPPSPPPGGDSLWLIIILIGVVVAGGVATYFILKRKGGSKLSFKKPNFKLPKWGKKK